MTSISHWQAELAATASALPRERLTGSHDTDVAIVGAGITGVAAALWLTRAGVHVVVLEGRTVAAGASGRNGGFLLSGTAESYSAAVARFGRTRARRIWEFSTKNHQIARELVGELAAQGCETGYRQQGSLRIAASESEMEEIQASLPLMADDNLRVERVTREELPTRLRGAYFGGVRYPTDGEIQPARFVTGIASLAVRAGARIYQASPVLGLTATDDGWRVRTPDGKVHARRILLATNALLPAIGAQLGADWLARAITPTRGQMLVTAPVSERLFDSPCYADDGYQYWRQLADGRLAIGGWRNRSFATEATTDETAQTEVQSHLDDFAHVTLGLTKLPIEQRWAGVMAFSADGLPLVGRVPGVRECYVAGGYTGHGNAYALHATQVVAALMLGGDHPAADLFEPGRFAESADSG
ncbi:MAG: NAD(P)/FAD-dependent oxidoreductase [Ktedonobacterales bacterium]